MSEISTRCSATRTELWDLNNTHAEETSYLSADQWQSLIDKAYSATCIDNAALLIAFDGDADYANTNFKWFSARFDQFVYIDRIIVSSKLRGTGAAQMLYRDLMERAGKTDHEWLVCEINRDPPNPVSDAFHRKLGFIEVGQARLAEKHKTVRYLALNIR